MSKTKGAYTLNLANPWKRFAAWILDFILLATIAVGVTWLCSIIFNFTEENAKLYSYYEQYGVYTVTDGVGAFCETDANYSNECAAMWTNFGNDASAVGQYQKVVSLTFIMLTIGVFVSTTIIYLVFPLIFRNGQTIGKKVMGVALLSKDEIQVSTFQVVTRYLIGNFTIMLMLPIMLLLVAIYFNWGLILTLPGIAIELGNIVAIMVTKNKQNIPDLIARTIPIDISSQIIAKTPEELSKYKYQDVGVDELIK
jgi:uncharacterized RDD family membrane protein YckC